MAATSFADFYKSDLQSVYALCVVPLLFLGWLLTSNAARASARGGEAWRRFLYLYCVVFALETILDPIATGPLTRWLGAGDSPLGTAILLTFVLLGDFRVYLLVFFFSQLGRPLSRVFIEAAGWTFVVPVFAYVVDSALHFASPGLPEQTIWLVYELAFLSIAIWLRTSFIPRKIPAPGAAVPRNGDGPLFDEKGVRPLFLRRGLESIAAYAAIYYALWATADVLIMVFGLDVGWALRVVPNQLYYAFFLPFVWFQLSSRR